jgi:hypothetical protein
VKKKKLEYFCRWTPGIERALQNKEMRGIKLHKNQELHSRKKIEEICAHLKAPSFKAFVFKRARGKFDYLASIFSSKSWRPSKQIFLCGFLWSSKASS